MTEITAKSVDILNSYNAKYDDKMIDERLKEIIGGQNTKIVVLDDDPTGVQTVHGINVYTSWGEPAMKQGFEEDGNMFFILTNSRAFTAEETAKVHSDIAKTAAKVSKQTGKDFILISRGDSTLRGHYPLETQSLKDTLEQEMGYTIDAEIIAPFFKEGGRFTIDGVHYVKEGDMLMPAGQTEFANDKTFGYKSSDLTQWVEEKTGGKYKAENCIVIDIEMLRKCDTALIKEKLMAAKNFNKVIVDAISYRDMKVFAIACYEAMAEGKKFMFRTAAAVPKVFGGVEKKDLLKKQDLISAANKNGGIVIVGSHVNKTTKQLEQLKNCKKLTYIEFNQHLVVEENGLENEVKRVVAEVNKLISEGMSVAVYTRRERIDFDGADKEKQLMMSVKISDSVTSIIEKLDVRPNFIIAKGGITSSDVGTKALAVKKATVMGQIKPGIPVWLTGEESKFNGMPYIIFPGNVGEDTTLLEIVEELMSE